LTQLVTTPARKFALRCWDLEVSPPACVATKTLVGFGSLTVNTDDASTGVLAVQSPSYVSPIFHSDIDITLR
jgi:hypothetical protein